MADIGERIRVFVVDHSGNKQREVKIAASAEMRQIIPALISALRMPVTDSGGRPVTYNLAIGERLLQEEETLASAGIVDASVLTLIPQLEMMVGAAFEPTESESQDRTLERSAIMPSLREEIRNFLRGHEHQISANDDKSWSIADASIQRLDDHTRGGGGGGQGGGGGSSGRSASDEPWKEGLVILQGRLEALEARVAKLEGSIVTVAGRILFLVWCHSDGRVSFSLGGALNRTTTIPSASALLIHELIGRARGIGTHSRTERWISDANDMGRSLYGDLFSKNHSLLENFGVARGKADNDESRVLLSFGGPAWHINMPYEFLYDENGPLALRFPLCRQVHDITSNRADSFESFLGAFVKRPGEAVVNVTEAVDVEYDPRRQLGVLIIDAGDVSGAASLEASTLSATITKVSLEVGVRTKIQHVELRATTFPEVIKLLERSRYHVIHFVGDVQQSDPSPFAEGLVVPALDGPRNLSSAWLFALLQASQDTRLVYISSASGAVVGTEAQLNDGPTIGLMHALLKAGVPIVVGHRLPVSREQALRFADEFYKGLFTTQCPAQAALHARRELAARGEPAWLSPIVVVQRP